MKLKKIAAAILSIVMIMSFTVTAGAVMETDGILYERIDSSVCLEIKGIMPGGVLSEEENVTIPYSINGNEVVKIGSRAFMNNGTVKQLFLPGGLKEISEYAMYGMSNLEEIVLPSNLQSLGTNAFYKCTSLQNVKFNTVSLPEIAKYTFFGCTNLDDVILSNSILVIDDYAFASCANMKRIYIPSSVAEISDTAFVGSNLVTIYGGAGSVAEYYASRKGIPFVVVDGKHTTGLINKIDTVKYFMMNDMSCYTEESVNTLETAYQNAVLVRDEFFSSQQDIDTVEAGLENAYLGLKLKLMPVLEEKLVQAKQFLHNPEMYREGTLDSLSIAVEKADKVVNKVLPSNNEVENAINRLDEGMAQLYELIKGDVNDDRLVNLTDAVIIQRSILGTANLQGEALYCADYNGDGKVSVADVVYIQRYIMT